MRKILFIFILLLFLISTANAQDLDAPITSWDGNYYQWSLSYESSTSVDSLATYDGNLFAGTGYNSGKIFTYDGTNWSESGDPASLVDSLATYNGNLFAGTGMSGRIYIYNGTSWSESYDSTTGNIYSLAAYDGNLFAGGGAKIYTYDGTNWGESYESTETHIYSLATYDGNLFAGTRPGGKIFTYNGTSWSESYDISTEDRVRSLAVYDGNLFAGTGINARVYTYDGNNWSESPIRGSTVVHALATYDGNLFAGTDGAAVYTYDGTNSRLSYDGPGNNIKSLATYDGNLFAGGGSDGVIYAYGPITHWYTRDLNVHLTCKDAGGGSCSSTKYRLDTDSSSDVSYDTWTTYDVNIYFPHDGNWAVDFNSTDDSSNVELTNTYYVLIDQTAPSTVADYNGTWQNFDANVLLTCTDANSGCSTTNYRLDTDSSSHVSYGTWQTYDTNIYFSSDGNWALDFNSTDVAGNTEDTNTIYILIDKTAPSTLWDGNTTWQNFDANIVLTCDDADGSGCSTTKYRLDTDSGSGVTYGTWTVFDANIYIYSDGNYALDFNSTDVLGNVGDVNTQYVLIDRTAPTTSWDGNYYQWSLNYDSQAGRIYSLAAYDGNLFAGIGRVYTYDGTNWNENYGSPETGIYSLAVYDGNLFAGTGQGGRIHTYDGTNWSESYDSTEYYINSLATYDGNLFAGGGNDGIIYTYDGTSWSESYASPESHIQSLATYDNNMFAGTFSNGIIYTYDGTSWSESYESPADQIPSLATYNGNLFAGSTNSGIIYTYDGTSWSENYNSPESRIQSLATYDGNLFAGSNPHGKIFTYDGTNWSESYSTSESYLFFFATYDGNLFAASGDSDGIIYTRGPITHWYTQDLNVHLTCTDTNSGCSLTRYRLDTDSSSDISYGAWQTYDANIYFSQDGNYALDFNSSDAASNAESTVTYDVLIDKTAPSTTADYNSTWQYGDANVFLTCTDVTSGCSSTKYRLDTDSSSGVTYGAWQTYDTNIYFSQDGNWALDFNSMDVAGNTEDTNTIYVLIDKTAPSTLWDGNYYQWSEIYDSPEGEISSLITYDGNLFAGGGYGNIYTYNGTSWSLNYDSPAARIHSLAIYDGNLFAGSGDSGKIYIHDGTSWSETYDSPANNVYSLATYDGNLFAGSGGDGKIYTYNGTSWSETYDSPANNVYSLATYDGNLFAGSGNDVGIIYTYDGTNWNVSYDPTEFQIHSLVTYDGNLFAGSTSNGKIYTYDGTNWNESYDSPEQRIYSQATYDGNLFAGSGTGGKIYTYDGTSWNETYDSPESEIRSLATYDGNLFAGSANSGIIYTRGPITHWYNHDLNVHLTCTDVGGGTCSSTNYRLDTDSGSGVTYGAWQTYDTNIYFSQDGNWALDFNSTDDSSNVELTNTYYVLIDKTAPTTSWDGNYYQWSENYDSPASRIFSLAAYDGNLFAGTYPGGIIYTYDGTNWNESYDSTKTYIFSLATYDGNLFAGSNSGRVYTYDGTNWNENYGSPETGIYSLAVYDGNLFAGSGNDGIIYTYDGTNWNESYDSSTEAFIFSLAAYDGNLFAGTESGGKIYTYDGTNWSEQYDSTESSLLALATYDGNLFAGTSGNGKIFTYNGTNWNESYDSTEERIRSLATYDGNLFAGTGDDDGKIYTYDGTNWSLIYDSTETYIYALATYDGNLFAGARPSGIIYTRGVITHWYNHDLNVHLTCTDTNSGCSLTRYRLDTDSSSDISYGAWQTYDANILFSQDGNYALDFNSSDAAGNTGSTVTYNVLIDKTAPSTLWDGNTTWQNFDVNIVLTCDDADGSGCSSTKYRLDTDSGSGVTYGTWTVFDANIYIYSDGNYALDFNSTDVLGNVGDVNTQYVLIDKTSPVTTAGGFNEGWQSSEQNITLSCTDANSGCSATKYRPDTDSGTGVTYDTWQTYTEAISFSQDGNWALDFNSMDAAGNTENTNTIYILIQSSQQQQGGTGIPSQKKEEEIISIEEVLFLAKEYIPLSAEDIPVLEETAEEIRVKRIATAEDITFIRSLKVRALFGAGGIIKYINTITVSVKNVSKKKLGDITLIEEVPEEILKNASNLSSDSNFTILEESLVIRFPIGDLNQGETAAVSYDFNRSLEEGAITEEMFNLMIAPLALVELDEESMCMGVYCNDFNPCTTDYCDKGECAFEEKRDGITCGEGMVCINGFCTEKEEPEQVAEEIISEVVISEKPLDFTALIAVLVVVLIITAFILAVRYGKRKRGRNS